MIFFILSRKDNFFKKIFTKPKKKLSFEIRKVLPEEIHVLPQLEAEAGRLFKEFNLAEAVTADTTPIDDFKKAFELAGTKKALKLRAKFPNKSERERHKRRKRQYFINKKLKTKANGKR